MEETSVCHEGLNHKEEDGKGEQLEPALDSNPSFNEQEDNQPNDVHEEIHPNFSYEYYNQHVEVCVSDIFEEDFSMPIYNECEDGHLDNTPKEPAVCNHRLDHLEEAEGPKWDVSSCFSNLEFQEECISPDFLEGA